MKINMKNKYNMPHTIISHIVGNELKDSDINDHKDNKANKDN